jgi:hypothetical protein
MIVDGTLRIDEDGQDPENAELATEVRQSLSLLAITALTLLVSIAIGILAGQLG